jgi:hypothetical protein
MHMGVYRFVQPCNLAQATTVCVATPDASIGTQHPQRLFGKAKDSSIALIAIRDILALECLWHHGSCDSGAL